MHQLFLIPSLESTQRIRQFDVTPYDLQPMPPGLLPELFIDETNSTNVFLLYFFQLKTLKTYPLFQCFLLLNYFFSSADRYLYTYLCSPLRRHSVVGVRYFCSFAVMLTLHGGSNVIMEEEPWTRAIPTRARLLFLNRAINRHRPTLPAIYTTL